MNSRIFVYLLIVFTFILLGYLFSYTGEVISEREEGIVTRIVDGDTFVINISGNEEKVRMLDINTPEKNEFYHDEALNFLNKTILGKTVYIESKKKDRYGRILGYVFYNDELINEKVIEQGYGHFYSYEDTKYTGELKNAEEHARKSFLGIWQKSTDVCGECIAIKDFDDGEGKDDCNAGTEFVVFHNKCDYKCDLNGWDVKDSATHIYKFENVAIDKDKSITLYNGVGDSHENDEMSFFWGNKGCASLWNDAGDALFLRDKEGKLVLYYTY